MTSATQRSRQSGMGAVTEGEVVVPREPTEEMVRIGTTAASYDEPLPVDDPGDPDYADDVRRIYRAMISAAPPKEAEPWRPIEDYVGTGPVMVSTAPESPKYLFSEPVSAFRDAAGVWRCLGSIGGMAELARKPTHFRTLPRKPDLVPIEKATSGETL